LIHVGHGTRTMRDGHALPCDIWISCDDDRFPLVLGEGVDDSSVASPIAAHELLEGRWADVATICRCEWLVDEISRLTDIGEIVTAGKLEEVWRKRTIAGVQH